MAWRLVEVDEAEASPSDLTDSELIGLSVALARFRMHEPTCVYARAYDKIQYQVDKAISNE